MAHTQDRSSSGATQLQHDQLDGLTDLACDVYWSTEKRVAVPIVIGLGDAPVLPTPFGDIAYDPSSGTYDIWERGAGSLVAPDLTREQALARIKEQLPDG